MYLFASQPCLPYLVEPRCCEWRRRLCRCQVLPAKPDNLTSIPGALVYKERSDLSELSTGFHKYTVACVHNVHPNNLKCNLKKNQKPRGAKEIKIIITGWFVIWC